MAEQRVSFSTIEQTLLGAANDGKKDITSPSPTSVALREASTSLATARDNVYRLSAAAGLLCSLFLTAPHDANGEEGCPERPSADDHPFWTEQSNEKDEIAKQMGRVFASLFTIAKDLQISMVDVINRKIELNARKYPVDLCKGKAGKYTKYSEQTGITATNQVTTPTKRKDSDETIEGITLLIRNFANERQWNRFHTPRNIALALIGEVGELAELFQWKGDVGELSLSEEELDKIGQEVADCAIYLLRLADVSHVCLGQVTIDVLDDARVTN